MEKSKDTFSIKNTTYLFHPFLRKEQESDVQTVSEEIPAYNAFPLLSNEEENDISVYDVAAYIVKKTGQISTMKLQKMVYYCQAWSLVWDEKPMFKEKIEAWANGPVALFCGISHKIFSTETDKIFGSPVGVAPKRGGMPDSFFEHSSISSLIGFTN